MKAQQKEMVETQLKSRDISEALIQVETGRTTGHAGGQVPGRAGFIAYTKNRTSGAQA